jgi:hypothetical protein
MRTPTPDCVPHSEILDKALNLREAVNSSRARLIVQRAQVDRLRRQIAELRAAVERGAETPPAEPAPRLRVSPRAAWKKAPYAALLAAAVAFQLRPAPRVAAGIPLASITPAPRAPLVPSMASEAVEDEGADEALLLVHEWRLPGDVRTLAERLGSSMELPGTRPAWTAERTGEHMYRVSFRESADAPGYDFDVDLEARRVDPTPETAPLISPLLTAGN